MKKGLIIVFTCIFILLLIAYIYNSNKEIVYYELRNTEEISNLTTNEPAIFIDVRGEKEFNSGHIRGAMNITYITIIDSNILGELDKNEYYVLYDDGGGYAEKAAAHMAYLGYENVYYFTGLDIWNEVLDVVESGEM